MRSQEKQVIEFAPGMEFRVPYPFVRTEYTEWDSDGPSKVQSWKPGVNAEHVFIPPDGDDTEFIADGMGEMILTIVSLHKPGHFPMRVFYTRRWRSPNGREFGKSHCRCAVTSKFRRLARGYQHEFEIRPRLKAA